MSTDSTATTESSNGSLVATTLSVPEPVMSSEENPPPKRVSICLPSESDTVRIDRETTALLVESGNIAAKDLPSYADALISKTNDFSGKSFSEITAVLKFATVKFGDPIVSKLSGNAGRIQIKNIPF